MLTTGCPPVTPRSPEASAPVPSVEHAGPGLLRAADDRSDGRAARLAGRSCRRPRRLDDGSRRRRRPPLRGRSRPETTTLRDAATGRRFRRPHPRGADAAGPAHRRVADRCRRALLLDDVESFVARGDGEVLAVRDERGLRSIWRVPIDGARPAVIAEVPLPADGAALGPFGFRDLAGRPDRGRRLGRWAARGRRAEAGELPRHRRTPRRRRRRPPGAVTGRAGDASLVEGDRLIELAPPDSDPLAVPGSGFVAWGTARRGRRAPGGRGPRPAGREARDLCRGRTCRRTCGS